MTIRWSKQERASVTVEQPSVVSFYNKGMGGVDHFDQMRGLYISRIRSKKWHWPIFRFCLNGAAVNMWFLYRYVDPDIGLVDFIRRACSLRVIILKSWGKLGMTTRTIGLTKTRLNVVMRNVESVLNLFV
ncbi:hypothetical protein NQ314_012443 [Rhamnusium bicolor]|uniref:PiggyBac transposable element-derived protein domain-containing protein n=1 Tax=Rhamnusium bicolor TaxID=1586634 RepID=A0AAV8XCQ7_9CUCU|nr:hypothetical protein NQ314_012443 [Rhamnusium bicolor]